MRPVLIMKKFTPLFVVLAIISLWFAYPFILTECGVEQMDQGGHGDMYGGLNTLFSGLAFAGLIYTVMLQREELGLQRKELELTRAELERTATANQEAAKAMAEQVKNQLLAARISAKAGLLASYDATFQTLLHGHPADYADARSRASQLRKELEEEISKVPAFPADYHV